MTVNTTILEACFLTAIGMPSSTRVEDYNVTLAFILEQLEIWCGKNDAWFDISYHKSYDVLISGDAIPEPKAETSDGNLKIAVMRAVVLAERMIHPKEQLEVTYVPVGTKTGRVSSKSPNLSNPLPDILHPK